MTARTFRIHVRYPTREGDRIVLRTSLDWDRDVEAVRVADDGRTWSFEVTDGDRPHLYFKVCRHRDGGFHWSVGANGIVSAEERWIYPHFDGGPKGAISDRFQIGTRTVRVYTPPGYAENTLKCYPTLYVHDGANVFFPDEAFSGVEWQIDETLDLLDAVHIVDRVVVVAVYASPERREQEYTPPGWQGYSDELCAVVKPEIDERYRTLTRPESTAVMGSSLGGVASFWLAWSRPDVFGMAACLSPSFGLRDDMEHAVWREARPEGIRVYLDSGWPGDNHEPTVAMRDALLSRGFTMGRDLLHLSFPGAVHHETAWAERLHLPFQFLFGHAFRSPPRC
ncbi:MAG: alpha/beta hydrolase [Myxococcales bacterium]|nr:alpha/beta hydrolase [Myxococcales bacterium]